MAKKRKHDELYNMARMTGENIGRITVESKKHSEILLEKGRKGVELTAQVFARAQTKAQKAADRVIPELITEFKKGLKKGMKKER